MADTRDMTVSQPTAPTKAPPGGFAVNMVWTGPSCEHCSGRSRIQVTNDKNKVIGFLESEYRWTDDIPDDVGEHPVTPHYAMDWLVLDEDMRELPEISASTSLHLAAAALLRRSNEAERA